MCAYTSSGGGVVTSSVWLPEDLRLRRSSQTISGSSPAGFPTKLEHCPLQWLLIFRPFERPEMTSLVSSQPPA
jgi:hypothetical protein